MTRRQLQTHWDPARNADTSRILAVLGPTNTGKTHFAVERMLAHRSGMIGFPLRLLAREIYDRVVAICGAGAVALHTGEEKISPPRPRYILSTVEAMPLGQPVAFLAIDEIQLCGDRERGHIFTDRLLNARGLDETMFLGAETIRPLMRRLVPEAEIVTRPRFSILSHAGSRKLTRLPRRSAVVAFTAADVYSLAEIVRRQRGGAAVVLGALSPRTRNAQVAMFQAGEVDHLIATDAVGMGLNMDVAHVAFAKLSKFDGRQRRRLTPAEIGQIAGRAGRHMQDGTFGTTHGVGEMDKEIAAAIEEHRFPSLRRLYWRSSDLDLTTLDSLLASLDAPPPSPVFSRVRHALDERSLRLLSRQSDVAERLTSPERVRLLWQVCRIPDFRKTVTDSHLHLLALVFDNLSSRRGTLPNDWVGRVVDGFDRTEGDIDTLVTRISHIRTWTYMSHRDGWLDDEAHWQERTRQIEDRLSDALHERLTQRFVDRRTSALLRSLRDNDVMDVAVDDEGEVAIDGHSVGHLRGLTLVLDAPRADAERRALSSAARKALAPELRERVASLIDGAPADVELDDNGVLLWRASMIGRLRPGADPLAPRIEVIADEALLSAHAHGLVRQHLESWMAAHCSRELKPLARLTQLTLAGPGRGIVHQLREGLGNAPADVLAELVHTLAPEDRTALSRAGVRFGMRHVYLPAMLKARPVRLRAILAAVHAGISATPPPTGRVSFARSDAIDADICLAAGFHPFAAWALRIDVVERLAAALRRHARKAETFELGHDLMSLTGLARSDLAGIVGELGFPPLPAEDGMPRFGRPRPVKPRGQRRRRSRARAVDSGSPFAVLASLKVST